MRNGRLTLLLCFLLVLTASSCERPRSEPPENSAASPAPSPALRFELRDFKLTTETDDYSTTYRGRGTVVTTDPTYRDLSGLLILRRKATVPNRPTEENRITVVIDKGVGIVETYASQPKKETTGPPLYEWTAVGWTELEEAELILK
jgi:hypothetical protein